MSNTNNNVSRAIALTNKVVAELSLETSGTKPQLKAEIFTKILDHLVFNEDSDKEKDNAEIS